MCGIIAVLGTNFLPINLPTVHRLDHVHQTQFRLNSMLTVKVQDLLLT